jgi:hypothetical protein
VRALQRILERMESIFASAQSTSALKHRRTVTLIEQEAPIRLALSMDAYLASNGLGEYVEIMKDNGG